jgi:HK97 family phage portal protein
MIVRTFDGLQALAPPQANWSSGSSSSVNLYGLNQAYAQIYRTQPNVRICVDFLARNIAHVGLEIFRRVSDTDRVRLVEHELARWLGKPNPSTGRYRLIESLISDLGIYFNAYLLKVRHLDGAGRKAIGYVRLPPEEMEVKGGLIATHYEWTSNGRIKRFELSEIVYFNGYNPLNPRMGLSPLETLRRILAEEAAAGEHREGFWRNAARMDGIVTRPATSKPYNETQAQSWREQWQAMYAGGVGAGRTLLLQGGETFTPQTFSAKDSEYTVGGKLRREICAAEYQIPQPFVGILEHATFSNIREQHKHLYQDCLGPWFEMVVQEFERQALPDCDDVDAVYLEFNIDAKMAGSFEEQAASLQLAVGKPFMKVNEARALRNLPRDEDPESDRIAPQQGGPSDATAHPTPAPFRRTAPSDEDDDDADAAAIAPVLHAARLRQQARVQRLPIAQRAVAFFADLPRWNRELTRDLTPIVGAEDAARRARRANAVTLTALIALEETAA